MSSVSGRLAAEDVTGAQQRRPVLITFGGLPATGKTTIAQKLAGKLGAVYIRIDTIETAIERSEGRFRRGNGWEAPPGYTVGYDVSADQLRNGLNVIAESVNPLRVTRQAWREIADKSDAEVIEAEIVCSDTTEHQRRAEERILDIPGLANPSWQQITNREYEPWERDHIVIDTATVNIDEAVHLIRVAAQL